MKKVLKMTGLIAALLVLVLVVLTLFSKFYFGRSLRATLAEYYLKFTIVHLSDREMEIKLLEKKDLPESPYIFSQHGKLNISIEETEFEQMPLLYLNKEGKGKSILYLHGGSYLHDPDPHHFIFLNKLIEKTDARVILPVYPKAPKHDFAESYDLLTKFYEEVSKEQEIILMGDSAGGGLAIGISQYFQKLGMKSPLGIIVFSPWIDLTMENPKIKEFEKVDPWLRHASSIPIAKSWANGTDLKDYRISPTYGILDDLKNLSIFVGTREILYPDIMDFVEKLKENQIEFNLFIGQGLNHVYPLFPIPEADEAVKQIANILENI